MAAIGSEFVVETRLDTCDQHGQYSNHRVAQFLGEPAWEGCPRCLFDAAHAADPAISGPARAERQARRLNLDLLAVGLPLRFRSKTLAGYQADTEEQGQALELCRAYAEQFQQNYQDGRSLMLLGSVGTGKTHLAAAIAVALVRMGAKVRYLLASELIRAIKATFGRDAARSEQQVYDEMLEPDLLIIDEIGVQHGTEFERNALFEVVNGRYGRMLPTLIISNLGPTELPACLGERVIDRFRENEGIAVVFRWPSARRAAP